jgi:MFS family permease
MKELASKPTFWTMTAGPTLAAFAGYGIFTFQTSFLIRNFNLSLGTAAIEYNVPLALAAAAGTFLLGFLADKISPRFPNAIAWLPGLGLLLSVPLFMIGFNSENPSIALLFLCIAALAKYGYLGAQYAIGASVVSMRTRATAIAILLFIINLIGYGLGPLFAGIVSDVVIAMTLDASQIGDGLSTIACKGANVREMEAVQRELCASANARGSRLALTIVSGFYLPAALMFFLSARTLQKDLVAR